MRNVTEIQQRLITLGYLAPTYIEDGVTKTNADGKFGPISLAAYNHWRASKGAGPVHAASMSQLNRDLFPEEQPNAKPALTPNPLVQAIGLFALKLALQRLTKGTITMDGSKPWYTSQTVWASALAILGTVLSFFHVNFGAADQATTVQAVVEIVTAVSSLWAIISRLRATKMIG